MYIERWQFARDAGIKRWCVTKTLDHTISGQRLFITPSWKWASVVQPSNFPWPVPTSSDSAIIRILLFGMLIITLVIIFILYSVLELQNHGHSGSKLACLVKQTGKPHFNLAGTKKPALTDIPDYLGTSFGQRAMKNHSLLPSHLWFLPMDLGSLAPLHAHSSALFPPWVLPLSRWVLRPFLPFLSSSSSLCGMTCRNFR